MPLDKSLNTSFKDAKKVVAAWGMEFKASQYSAWILNDGNHRTKGKKAANWNAQLSKPLRLDIERPTHHLVKEMEEALDTLLEQVLKVFEELHESATCKL
jgi:hypothetical protein